MAKRIKKKVVVAPTKSELPEVAQGVALSQSQLKKLEAQMEEKINKVRASYQDKIDELRGNVTSGIEKLEAYVIAHEGDFMQTRSMDVVHGRIGLRTGTPKVVIAKGMSRKVAGILQKAGLNEYLRSKIELDKETIISKREDKELMQILQDHHITVEQDESFYFEPKEEEAVLA